MLEKFKRKNHFLIMINFSSKQNCYLLVKLYCYFNIALPKFTIRDGKTKLEMDENEQTKTSTLKLTVIYEADRSR